MQTAPSPRPRPAWAQRPGPNPLVREAPAQKGDDARAALARLRLLGAVSVHDEPQG